MRTRSVASAKRNEQIKRFRDRGWTLQRIAERYQISPERVCQIVNDPESHVATAAPKRRGRPKGSRNRTAA